MAKRTNSYEDEWLSISGTIGGSYMAMLNGANPRHCMDTIWEAHQALLRKRGDLRDPKRDDGDHPDRP